MSFRSLLTAICVLVSANMVSAAPFAYVANSGTRNVTVIDTADDSIKATIPLPDTNPSVHPYAYSVTVGASGQNVYVGLQDTNEVSVIDTASNNVVKRISLGTDSPGGLAVNTAETRLYVTSNKTDVVRVIDISGIGASEVGRVTVDTHSISAPEGIVLNPAGTRAYVANSATGSIAEISLDEAGNIYNLLSVTDLGGSVQPMGLAITSDGAKLYIAALNGSTYVMDTATKTFTSAATGSGSAAIALKPDNSMAYTNSFALDKFYTVDASNTVTSYDATPGPWGVAITPDGTKVYIAMNLGEKVKVFNTASSSFGADITGLPSGAKPISMGNFIGPVMPFTITASAGTNCSISPSGSIPANTLGRSFSVTASVDQCEIITGATACNVSGTSKGIVSLYPYTPIAGNVCIYAKPVTGTFYTLNVDWIDSTTNNKPGCLKSTPVGVDCATQSAKFLAGTSVTIGVVNAGSHSVQTNSWTGACAGQGPTCTIVMNSDMAASATIINKPTGTGPVYNRTTSIYYQTLEEAFAAAGNNNEIDVVKTYSTASAVATGGSTDILVTLKAGYTDDTFTSQTPAGVDRNITITNAPLTINKVGIIADNLVI